MQRCAASSVHVSQLQLDSSRGRHREGRLAEEGAAGAAECIAQTALHAHTKCERTERNECMQVTIAHLLGALHAHAAQRCVRIVD